MTKVSRSELIQACDQKRREDMIVFIDNSVKVMI